MPTSNDPNSAHAESEPERNTRDQDSFLVVMRGLLADTLGTLAIFMVVGMVFDVIPVNPLTLGVVTFSGLVSLIAEIRAFRKRVHP
jgi:hypothetical protein